MARRLSEVPWFNGIYARIYKEKLFELSPAVYARMCSYLLS